MLKNCLFVLLCLHGCAYAAEYEYATHPTEYAAILEKHSSFSGKRANPCDPRYSPKNFWERGLKNIQLTGAAILLIEADRNQLNSKEVIELYVNYIAAKGASLTSEKPEKLKPKLREELLARKAELEMDSNRL